MSGFLARLVVRSVHTPEAGQPDAADGRPSVAGEGPGTAPARDTLAGSVRPRLPSRYERAWPDAGAPLDAEAGPDDGAAPRAGEVAAPGAAPSGEQRGSRPLRPAAGTGRAAVAGPRRTRDDGESAPAAPEPERRQPAGAPVARVEPRSAVVPAPEGPQTGQLAEDVTGRVLKRLAREGRLAPPVAASERASTTTGAADAPTAEASEAPAGRTLPAPGDATTRGTGSASGSQAPVPPGDHSVRQPRLRLPASDFRPREPETTAIRPPGGVSPRPVPGPRGRPRAPAVPEPPRIRVSIGRVEVRAVHPAQAPATSPERRPQAGPLTSLEEYLKQREAGA